MTEWQGKPQYSEGTYPKAAVHHRSHMTWSGFEPGPPGWGAGDCHSHCTAKLRVNFMCFCSFEFYNKLYGLHFNTKRMQQCRVF
jgi:hypothetical protein